MGSFATYYFIYYVIAWLSNLLDEEIFGDFEDLETGEITSGNPNADEDSGMESEGEDNGDNTKDGEEPAKTKEERRAEKKRKLKEMFNADYDDGKGNKDCWIIP